MSIYDQFGKPQTMSQIDLEMQPDNYIYLVGMVIKI